MAYPALRRDFNHIVIQATYEETAFQGEYDVNDNLIYSAQADPGSNPAVRVWQIRKLTYSGQNLTKIEWPQLNGVASTSYSFAWSDRATYTYS